MPTKRTRAAHSAILSGAALDWLETEEAVSFFTDPEHRTDSYHGITARLPGMRPWWPPLCLVFQVDHFGRDAECLHARDVSQPTEFVRALYNAWKRKGRRRANGTEPPEAA